MREFSILRWVLALAMFLLPVASQADPASTPPRFRSVIAIDGNNSWTGTFHSRIGRQDAPKVGDKDFEEALNQFADPYAAYQRLAELKQQLSPDHGRIFVAFDYIDEDPLTLVAFDYDFAGEARVQCGVTTSDRLELKAIVAGSPGCIPPSQYANASERAEFLAKPCGFASESQGTWAGFKRSTSRERVREVARCLSKLKGMPALKPAPHVIKHLMIDEAAYAYWEKALQKLDPKSILGTPEQRRKELDCLVSEAARELPDASEDTVILRYRKDKPIGDEPDGPMRSVFAVTSQSNAKKLWEASYLEDYRGPWATVIADEPRSMLPGCERHLDACRRQAGIFELPPSSVSVGAQAPQCH